MQPAACSLQGAASWRIFRIGGNSRLYCAGGRRLGWRKDPATVSRTAPARLQRDATRHRDKITNDVL